MKKRSAFSVSRFAFRIILGRFLEGARNDKRKMLTDQVIRSIAFFL